MSTIIPHYRENRHILADIIPLQTPLSIQIEASQKCNLSCLYCIHSFGKNVNNKLMMFPTLQEICRQMGEFDDKIKQINFSGWGEPLMNRTLPLMIEHLKQASVAENIAVVTNGLLLTPEISLALVKAGVDHIRISLQGMSGWKYKQVCGKKIDFNKFVDNIRFLYRNKKNCQVSAKVADIALMEFDDEVFYDTFQDISDRMYIEHIRPMFPENKPDGKIISKFGIEHRPVIVCPQPFFMMAVTAIGDVIPCCSYYDPMGLGNIKDRTLKTIWEGRRLELFQRDMLRENRHNQTFYDVCQKCLMPDAITLPEDNLDDRRKEIEGRI